MQQLTRKPTLLIAGNGMAAGRLVDEILKRNPDKFDITVVGQEPEGSYNRIMLSPVLAGEVSAKGIIQKDAAWYRRHNIRFVAGGTVDQVYTDSRHLRLCDGRNLFYDELVLATGALPAPIPAENQHLRNIFAFRTLRDVAEITARAPEAKRAVVVGGGLLGLEAAHGLALQGMAVTVVHRSGWLMNRQLDQTASGMLQREMESRNISFELSTEIQSFSGDDSVSAAHLSNGKQIDCDMVVIATGITPNAELGKNAKLQTNRGVIVDRFMGTSDKYISALGECCEFDGTTFGLVEPIWEQSVTLAARLCNHQFVPFSLKPIPTKLKVSGINLFSSGDYMTRPDHRELVMHDTSRHVYRKLLVKDNRITGIVLFGDVRDGLYYHDLMQEQTDISQQLPHLVFGRSWYRKSPQAAVNQKKPIAVPENAA